MNVVFLGMVGFAFLVAALRELGLMAGGPAMDALGKAMIEAAGGAVTLAIGLIGVMTLFLGLMKVAEAAGLLRVIARALSPLLVRLFPDVPAGHPAMGAIVMNMSANVLGLGNAATPFGIRAMQQLERLNPHKGTASDAMVLFLAINTSSVTLLPTGVIALRAAAGSNDPAGILPTTLFATVCSTAAAIVAAKLYRRWSPLPASSPPDAQADAKADTQAAAADQPAPDAGEAEAGDEAAGQPYPFWVSLVSLGAILALVPLSIAYGSVIAPWIVPGLMMGFLLLGAVRRVPVYEALVEGAKDGFQVAVRIIPYLVAILVAVAMLRSSGAMDLIVTPIGWVTAPLGLPGEALPMALLRPLSGSGAYGLLAALINDPAIGPDSYTGYLVSTLQGTTETTFYVLAVYFGAVQIRRIRHALAAGLTADVVGVIAAVVACSWLLA